MPGQTKKKQPSDMSRRKTGVSNALQEQELANLNRNIQHRDALRLALGSILTPKRPYSPSSRPQSKSSSGSSSPALSYSFSSPPSSSSSLTTPPLPPTPPHSTPLHMHGHRFPDPYLHPLHAHNALPHVHQIPHPHTPSRLGVHDPNSGDYLSANTVAAPASTTGSPQHSPHPSMSRTHSSSSASQQESHSSEAVSTLAEHGGHDIHATVPVQATASHAPSARASGGTSDGGHDGQVPVPPKARFIETLQSKSAWDALIHGSFS